MSETIRHPENESLYGRNVKIRNFWQRHSQKQSGAVFNPEATGLSASSISEGGRQRAESLGSTITASTHGSKGYKSNSPRTEETFEALMQGYKSANPSAPVREQVRFKKELVAAEGEPAFLQLYNAKWNENKKNLLAQGILKGKYPNVEFDQLTPDQQEEIAETAEEPVILEWVDNKDSELAKAYPPKLQAEKFAKLFNLKHERMAQKLRTDSEVDLFHNTHKTVTEPFLASGVLIRKSDSQRITKLAEIGGSLKILDNWESEVCLDSQGQSKITITIRGQEYYLDEETFKNLISQQ
jgi:hypothetical protein